MINFLKIYYYGYKKTVTTEEDLSVRGLITGLFVLPFTLLVSFILFTIFNGIIVGILYSMILSLMTIPCSLVLGGICELLYVAKKWYIKTKKDYDENNR